MNDLTDKWKKGEFIICNAGKCQYYYVQNEEQREVIKTEYCLFDDNTPNWQILAPVPSYEEWQRIFHYAGKYEHEYTSCVMDYENLKEENQHLKELLRECRELFDELNYLNMVEKIDNAIGEK